MLVPKVRYFRTKLYFSKLFLLALEVSLALQFCFEVFELRAEIDSLVPEVRYFRTCLPLRPALRCSSALRVRAPSAAALGTKISNFWY